MKLLIPLLLLTSCSTLLTGGMAAGGAVIGSLISPVGAAAGAAAGVVGADLLVPPAEEGILVTQEHVCPDGGLDGLICQVSHFIKTAGWWYLILFVLVPLLSRRGRGWVTSFLNSASKKQVLDQDERLNTLEELISSLKPKGKKK